MAGKEWKTLDDLELYKSASGFRKKILEMAKKLPKEEDYVISPQTRRAAIAVTNQIAAGHGRYQITENLQFLRHSRGSLEEVIDDLNILKDQKYFSTEYLEELKMEGYELLKRINSYIAYLKKMKPETNPRV